MFENSVTNVRGAETSKFWPNPQFGDFRSKHSFSTQHLFFRYSLFAVVNHSGTLEVGHYTCFVRQKKDQVIVVIIEFDITDLGFILQGIKNASM